jgi:hypothetical protein
VTDKSLSVEFAPTGITFPGDMAWAVTGMIGPQTVEIITALVAQYLALLSIMLMDPFFSGLLRSGINQTMLV